MLRMAQIKEIDAKGKKLVIDAKILRTKIDYPPVSQLYDMVITIKKIIHLYNIKYKYNGRVNKMPRATIHGRRGLLPKLAKQVGTR